MFVLKSMYLIFRKNYETLIAVGSISVSQSDALLSARDDIICLINAYWPQEEISSTKSKIKDKK